LQAIAKNAGSYPVGVGIQCPENEKVAHQIVKIEDVHSTTDNKPVVILHMIRQAGDTCMCPLTVPAVVKEAETEFHEGRQ
jgi:hypothetical protein